MTDYLSILSIILALCSAVGFVNASYSWSAKDSLIKQIVKICTVIASSIGLAVSVMIMLYTTHRN